MLAWLKRDRKPRQADALPDDLVGMSMCVLPDELVVDILSRLRLKSVCRFKCVCKSWLAFSSDPRYSQKLPRTPAGLMYRKRKPGRLPWSPRTAIHLARLPASDMEIDTRLNFLPPRYKYSKLEDCSNGLLLSYHGGNKSQGSFNNAIVCNPATQKWLAIPNTEPGPPGCRTDLRLCFDPLWSQHFRIFEFRSMPTFDPHTISFIDTTQVKVFFSEDSTWSNCLRETQGLYKVDESLFINGVLYLKDCFNDKILALDAPEKGTQWLNHKIIQLPRFRDSFSIFCKRCLGQSSGVLCYAKHDSDACRMLILSLEGPDNRWVVKHDVSMTDLLRRDKLYSFDWRGDPFFHYVEILAFDLEREIVILNDKEADRVISVSTVTGKASRFRKIPRKFTKLYRSLLYVPYYGEVPDFVRSQ